MITILKKILWASFALLAAAGCDGKNDPGSEDTGSPVGDIVSGLSITISQNGKSVAVPAEFDKNSDTFVAVPATNNWIDNIGSAVVSFDVKSPGVRFYVGDREQTIGETPNDLTSAVNYRIETGDGDELEFTVRLASPQSSGLPVVSIDTNGAAIKDKVNYVPATLSLSDKSNPEFDLDDQPLGIRGRGNSTWGYPKKPYRLKFDKRTSLFGLGAAKSWVLLANFQDPTLMTATVTFEIARRVGFPNSNHINHVELFLNGVYRGSYALTEQVQVDKERVNIDEENGFLLELDKYFDETYKFLSPRISLPVNVKSPEVDNDEGIGFVKTAFNGFEALLFGGPDNTPLPEYRDHIDMDALIDFILINEIVQNAELNHPKSTYLHRDAVGKIVMGPLWDFDWAFGFGDANYFTFNNQLYYKKNLSLTTNHNQDTGAVFFNQFFKDPEFVVAYKARWNEIKPLIADMDKYVEETADYLLLSSRENDEEWREIRKNVIGGGLKDFETETAGMAEWLAARLRKLDAAINSL